MRFLGVLTATMLAAPALAAAGPASQDDGSSARTGFHISNQERRAAAEGHLIGFWRSRYAVGDPVACIALARLDQKAAPAMCQINGWMASARLGWFLPPGVPAGQKIRQIQTDLMREHVRAVDDDRVGVAGLLSPEQVADYHHRVFERHGLPFNAFGGTPVSGATWEANWTAAAWCGGCDRAREGVR